MPRQAYNFRICVAKEDFEDTTIYFYNHNIFEQTSTAAGPTAMSWPLEEDHRNRDEIALEIFEEFYPQELTFTLPDASKLSCDLYYEVEASGKVAEAITIYIVTKQGNPVSIRMQMYDNTDEIANSILLRQFEEWFETKALPKLVEDNI
ncbi:MAG: hypothetical protein CMO44_02820 [Verrucomicrobiales bacterium]|nr:hypothetical protein [Verrucomicrobiales bacterium]